MSGRPVRVIIEGTCSPRSATGRGIYLLIDLPDDTRAVVYNARPGVTVEWLPERHDWRQGDVIVHDGVTWVRAYAAWAAMPSQGGGISDARVDTWVAEGADIRRYQAGETSSDPDKKGEPRGTDR